MAKRFIIRLLILGTTLSHAQVSDGNNLFTDRDIYASGENVWFKVFLSGTEQSGFIHTDLISNLGIRISGVTTVITEHQSDGTIYLPDSISSGSYLVRVSTRTGKKLIFKEIFVVNRFNGISGLSDYSRPGSMVPIVNTQIDTLPIYGIEQKYKTRTKGHLTIRLPDEFLSRIDGNLIISIADNTLQYNARAFEFETRPTVPHITEKEGIILEGMVTDLATGHPFEQAIVYLSILDSIPGFNYYITRKDGRFFFELKNLFGKVPAVVQCFDKKENRPLKITIFDPENSRKELPSFKAMLLPAELSESIDEICEVVNMRKVFNQQEFTSLPVPRPVADAHPFYSVPTKSIDLQLFIDLPDFSEISRELLSGVKYRIRDQIATLQVYDPYLYEFFSEPPLLLLDGIPILDPVFIQNMGSKEIDRVEVCQIERFYGDLKFQGIVAIHSSKNKYSRLPESDNFIRLELNAIQIPLTLCSPSEQSFNEPDLRQLLLWEPSVKPEHSITFDFLTSDVRGRYKLVIRGKEKDHSFFYQEHIFEIE